MTKEEIQPFLGMRVTLVLDDDIDYFQRDAAEGAGTLHEFDGDSVVWGESLGTRWIPLACIRRVEPLPRFV